VKNKSVMHEEIQLLSHEDKINILRKAKDICFLWNVDILDCAKSWRRERIDIGFEEALKKFDIDYSSNLTVFIRDDCNDNYLEICWSTLNSNPDYFIWLLLHSGKLKKIKKIIEDELKNTKG